MTSKRFNARVHARNFMTGILAAASFCTISQAFAAEADKSTLPVIHYVGVIPVQWDKEDTWSDLGNVKKSVDKNFSEAVRASHRFSALNDDLVSSMWSTPAGRKELASDYELQAFATLNMTTRADTVIMTTRILSPTLDTWLQESEVVNRSWLLESSKDQVVSRLDDLIHRMINRLPVDVHITSVNGSFVTLSGGDDQSLHVGDQYDVVSAKIQTLHPANGSWLTFSSGRTGKVQMVEVKRKSSIAKIISLTSENAVAVGQGIRVEAISGRSRFARPDGSDSYVSSTEKEKEPSGLASALTPDGKPVPVVEVKPTTAPASKPEASKAAEPAKTEPAAETPPTEATGEPAGDPGDSIMQTIAPPGSEVEAYAGLKSWAIGGSGSASTALPLWLINAAGVGVTRKFSEKVIMHYGLGLGYGQTEKGSFFGYDLHAAGIYKMAAKVFDGADFMYGGLQAEMSGLSIGGETSGGHDLTSLSLLLGIGGDTTPGFIGNRVDWAGELKFALQESGSFGVNGSRAKVKGGQNWLLRLQGYLGPKPKEGPQWGGAFEFGSANYNLSNSNSATVNTYSILGLMRTTL